MQTCKEPGEAEHSDRYLMGIASKGPIRKHARLRAKTTNRTVERSQSLPKQRLQRPCACFTLPWLRGCTIAEFVTERKQLLQATDSSEYWRKDSVVSVVASLRCCCRTMLIDLQTSSTTSASTRNADHARKAWKQEGVCETQTMRHLAGRHGA
jgi:hypothetical protein